MLPNEVPADAGLDQSQAANMSAPSGGLGLSQRPVFQPGYGPQSMGEAYQPADHGGNGANVNFREKYLAIDKKKMEEAEDVGKAIFIYLVYIFTTRWQLPTC